MTKGAGRCLCGAVRYKFDPTAVIWAAYCHCESCRRATSAPVAAWFGVRASAWRWVGQTPAEHASTPGVLRRFCSTCGSPMSYESSRWPDEIHGLIATLDDPGAVAPTMHVYHAERLCWFETSDTFPRHAGSAPD